VLGRLASLLIIVLSLITLIASIIPPVNIASLTTSLITLFGGIALYDIIKKLEKAGK